MDREPEPFDWGFGATPSGAAPGQPSADDGLARDREAARQAAIAREQAIVRANAAARSQLVANPPVRRQTENAFFDDSVSYNPHDLGFEEVEIAPKSFLRRLIPVIVTLAIIGGIVVGGTIAVDGFLRDSASSLIGGLVGTALKVEEGGKVDVDLGGGLFLAQAASGSIDDVHVDVSKARVGPLSGALSIAATGVPTSPSVPADSLAISLRLNEESAVAFATALQGATATPETTPVTLGEGTMTVGSTVIFGRTATAMAVTYLPSVVEGALVLTPQTITVGTTPMTVEEFAASRYAAVGKTLMDARTVCVASSLPAKLTLETLSIAPKSVTITATGKNVPIAGGGLTTLGVCEPAA